VPFKEWLKPVIIHRDCGDALSEELESTCAMSAKV